MEIKILASGSSGNCYYVNDGKTPLLLECGLPFQEIRLGLGFRVSEIAACLVSHEHQDHAKAVKDMLKAGIDCYMSEGTRVALGVSGHRIQIARAKEQFVVGTWTVLPFDTVHDAAEPLGFLLASSTGGKLLYATDTAYLRYRFRGLTHIMVEANYSMDILRANVETGTVPVELKNRLIKSHFSLENVKDFFRANDLSRVQEIWLLHLSDNNSDAERFKREIMELTGKLVHIA
jgi:phosphoribosyl 1,2-cyclic phosphodiesterase